MTTSTLPPGYSFSTGIGDHEVAELTDLIVAAEKVDCGRSVTELSDIKALRAANSDDAQRRMWQIRHDGVMVAAGALTANGHIGFDVHPEHRGLGLDDALWAQINDAATTDGHDHVLVSTFPNAPTVQFMTKKGGTVHHVGWEFVAPIDGLKASEPPQGFTLGTVDEAPDKDATLRALWRVIEDSFAHWPGRSPRPYEEWEKLLVQHEGSSLKNWWVVRDQTGDVVGGAVCLTYDDELWVSQLAVREDQRSQGLGGVLLAQAARHGKAAGFTGIGLDTDSRTGAKDLYLRVGFHISVEHHTLTVPIA